MPAAGQEVAGRGIVEASDDPDRGKKPKVVSVPKAMFARRREQVLRATRSAAILSKNESRKENYGSKRS